MQKRISLTLLVLSVLAMVNVVFVPLFDVWGGLFPSNPDDNFFEVVEMLIKDADHNWHLWVVEITVSIFIPCVFMLIFALTGSRKLCAASAGIGILSWLGIMIHYIKENEMSDVFDLDDSSISIGTWIAILLFVVTLIVSLHSGHKKSE